MAVNLDNAGCLASPTVNVPLHIFPGHEKVAVEQIDLGGVPFDLPFHQDRVACAEALGRVVQRLSLPVDALETGALPEGIIFHSGRCGSTLVTRALAEACHVVSEAQAINDLLGGWGWRMASSSLWQRSFSHVLRCLERDRPEGKAPYILKFSSWNAIEVSRVTGRLARAACLYLYRDPEEVLVSLLQSPPSWAWRVRHDVAIGMLLDLAPSSARMTPCEFHARVLGLAMERIADAVERDAAGRWLLVNHDALPGAVLSQIFPYFGVPATEPARAAFALLAQNHAKSINDPRPYHCDRQVKRTQVTPEIRDCVQRWAAAPYARLEALRNRSASAP